MRSKVLLAPLYLFFLSSSFAQTPSPFDLNKYISTISISDLKTHLEIVASDEMEGRDTGTEGQKKSGVYLINTYKNNGISFPKGATDFYQKVPSAFMNCLPDSENIWAFIEGTEKPEEIVVVSAHYDHIGIIDREIYNGADDDGSGTVALLEIAQAFQEAKNDGHGPQNALFYSFL